jgi:hypothetical protein
LGTFALKSPKPHDFMAADNFQLAHLQPLFSLAIKNALDELDHQVQAIIKEKCTAIHPTVEWRFHRVAHDYLLARQAGHQTEIEPIVFKNVYPVYGATDVRGSTDERNRAIQEDLRAHLSLAREVVVRAAEKAPLPILNELVTRIGSLDNRLSAGLGTGDEYQVVHFLSRDVESIFEDLEHLGPEVAQAVEAYRAEVDPALGTVYQSRRKFEASVSRLNDRLAVYLDWEEANLQASFPHYFERHRTDGVDYTMYLGASLMEDGRFNRLYLQNLRLWQIMVACGLAWHNERLKAELEFPLDTAHLILIQDSPLSIRFRYDEKRFDVDGAYDIRHEIVRSRLDKAVVKGSGERLTQPGRVAIVYSQPGERIEIKRHLDYLRGEGFLTGEQESLDLEEMPGVQGLRALRVGIDLDSKTLARRAGAIKS